MSNCAYWPMFSCKAQVSCVVMAFFTDFAYSGSCTAYTFLPIRMSHATETLVLYILKRSMGKAKRKDQAGNSEKVENVLFFAQHECIGQAVNQVILARSPQRLNGPELCTVHEISKLISHRCMQQAEWHNDPALGGWNRQKLEQQTAWCVRILL